MGTAGKRDHNLGQNTTGLFLAAAEHAVWHRYGEHAISEKRGRVRIDALGVTRSLRPAARACADSGLATTHWRHLLGDSIDDLLNLPGPPPMEEDLRVQGWERAKGLLRPLAVAPARLTEVERPIVQWLTGAAPVALVIATGEATRLVDKSMLDSWGVHPGEAQWAAKSALFHSGSLEVTDATRSSGLYHEMACQPIAGRFGLLSARPPFASGHLVYFDRYINEGQLGAAVAVPSEDTVLIRPVEASQPSEASADVKAMAADAAARLEASERPVARNVFLHRPDSPTAGLGRHMNGRFKADPGDLAVALGLRGALDRAGGDLGR